MDLLFCPLLNKKAPFFTLLKETKVEREREREREREEMERKVVVVCAAVGLLGLLSAALGFAAEATRVKVKGQRLFLYCGE